MIGIIEKLFSDVVSIENKYKEQKDKEDEFNIFRVLRLNEKEIIHSRLIAALLNTKDEHMQGNKFLDIFVQIVSEKIGLDDSKRTTLQLERSFAKAEHGIGKIRKNYTEGGSIDIILFDHNNTPYIIIENKIKENPKEEKNQLLRYYNYGKNYGAWLLYLTLDGRAATDYSTNKGKLSADKYYRISYKNTIVPWLEECLTKIDINCNIRSTVQQYISSLKDTMKEEEIENLFRKNKEYVQNIDVDIIKKSYNNLISSMKTDFFNELRKRTQLENKIGRWKDYTMYYRIDEYDEKDGNYVHLGFYLQLDKQNEDLIYEDSKFDSLRSCVCSINANDRKDPGWKQNENYIGWLVSEHLDDFANNLKKRYEPPQSQFIQKLVDEVLSDFKPIIDAVQDKIEPFPVTSE